MRISLAFLACPLIWLCGCDSTPTAKAPTTVARPSYDSAPPSLAPRSSDDSPASTTVPKLDSTEPDNTAVNERDRGGATKTPIDQNENQRDVSLTAEIRKAVLAREQMSINARNVKIITAEGKVTLRGPVNSEDERQVIDGIAKKLAGAENVTNEIDVKRGE